MQESYDREWHLDKRVPIALIITLLIQTASAVWWAASINSRVDVLEAKLRQLDDNPGRIVRVEERQRSIEIRLGRIESLQQQINEKLDRLLFQQQFKDMGPRK